jgi:hypothetical protein
MSEVGLRCGMDVQERNRKKPRVMGKGEEGGGKEGGLRTVHAKEAVSDDQLPGARRAGPKQRFQVVQVIVAVHLYLRSSPVQAIGVPVTAFFHQLQPYTLAPVQLRLKPQLGFNATLSTPLISHSKGR